MTNNASSFEIIKPVCDAFSAPVWTCRSPDSVARVGSPFPLASRAIFRVVWEVEQAFPTALQFWPSPGALVVDSLDAGWSPRDAARRAPVDAPAPGDCAQWRRRGSSVQIALGCAAWVVPTTSLACRSDSHVRARSAADSPRPPLARRRPRVHPTETNSRAGRGADQWPDDAARGSPSPQGVVP